jgi:hypothetical protein
MGQRHQGTQTDVERVGKPSAVMASVVKPWEDRVN